MPGTDARLLNFAQAVKTRHQFMYFLRKTDYMRRVLEFRTGQVKLPRGETAPLVTLAMEALEEWCKKVGPEQGYVVRIRGRYYSMSMVMNDLKGPGAPWHGSCWPFNNIINQLYQFLQSPVSEPLKQMDPDDAMMSQWHILLNVCLNRAFPEKLWHELNGREN